MKENTKARIEPDIDPMATDENRVKTSIAISLKRIADILEKNLKGVNDGHD